MPDKFRLDMAIKYSLRGNSALLEQVRRLLDPLLVISLCFLNLQLPFQLSQFIFEGLLNCIQFIELS